MSGTSPNGTVVALVGPTASGKSALALAVAAQLGDVEIVSVDAMQVYRGMDIGTAKPTAAEREAVVHHVIDVVDPHEDYAVARYQRDAIAALDDIAARGKRALLVGGTGLYLRAVVDRLEIPGQFAEVRAELGLARDAPLILFAGRLAPQKGVADLLTALDLLQYGMPELRTLIVGDGPLRSQLEEIAHAFELDGKVRFLGHSNDVPRLLAAADLLVLPSLYEGLPNVVLEAMRFAKPVVATAAPGTTEVVVDGSTGLLVPPGDPPALARAMRTLLRDPDLGRRLGAAGRARVETEFRADTMIQRFASLYEELAMARQATARPALVDP